MSFLFELDVEDLTMEQAETVAAASVQRGAWPVGFGRARGRWRGLFRARAEGRLMFEMPASTGDGRHILSDDAIWDAPAWAMVPELLPLLAETTRVLADELPQGFALRATWVGSEVRQEVEIDAERLAELVLASELNEFTRYRVPALTVRT